MKVKEQDIHTSLCFNAFVAKSFKIRPTLIHYILLIVGPKFVFEGIQMSELRASKPLISHISDKSFNKLSLNEYLFAFHVIQECFKANQDILETAETHRQYHVKPMIFYH